MVNAECTVAEDTKAASVGSEQRPNESNMCSENSATSTSMKSGHEVDKDTVVPVNRNTNTTTNARDTTDTNRNSDDGAVDHGHEHEPEHEGHGGGDGRAATEEQQRANTRRESTEDGTQGRPSQRHDLH